MNLSRRHAWARAFITAGREGYSKRFILGIASRCAAHERSLAPLAIALRVVMHSAPRPERSAAGPRPRTWPAIALGVMGGSVALWTVLVLQPPHAPEHRRDAMPDDSLKTDWLARDAGVIAAPMPSKRMERQRAPPCAPPPSKQVEINGACWSEVVEVVPCGQFYEHGGKCYVPVRETPRQPTSVTP